MKKQILAGLAVAGMTLGLAGPAQAQPPRHSHVKLIHADIRVVDGQRMLFGYHRCIDLRAQGDNWLAHHHSIHTGRAGEALREAGHVVAPTTPLSPLRDCAHLASMTLPIPFGPPPGH